MLGRARWTIRPGRWACRPGRRICTRARLAAHALPNHTIFFPAGDGADDEAPVQTALPSGDSPIACLLGWVGCGQRAMRKYATLYTTRGVDVVAVLLKPEHVYMPVTYGRATTEKIVDALSTAEAIERPIMIQGFSAGAYMYGNLLSTLDARGSDGVAFTKRIRGFCFDSPVDLDGVPFGLSRAMLGNSSEGTPPQIFIQMLLAAYLSPNLPMRQYYQASSDAMHGKEFAAGFTSPFAVPSAFLYSAADSVTVPADIQRVCDKWRAAGSDVEQVEFDGSAHVSHLLQDPQRYEAVVAGVIRKAFGPGA